MPLRCRDTSLFRASSCAPGHLCLQGTVCGLAHLDLLGPLFPFLMVFRK